MRRGSRALLDLERASWRAVRANVDDIPRWNLVAFFPGPSLLRLQPCSRAHTDLTVWFVSYRSWAGPSGAHPHGRGTPRGHKKDPLAGAAGEEASLCVVFQRNVSTAMPDLDSGVGTGLGDRVVFLDRVAYCPLQYALRSPTMNRVEMESSLSSSCSESYRL